MNWLLTQAYVTFRAATWPAEFCFSWLLTVAVLLSCDPLVRHYVIRRVELQQEDGGMSVRLLFQFRRAGQALAKDIRKADEMRRRAP